MMKVEGRRTRLGMISPLALSHGFRLFYEGHAGERHRVRLSRHLPGGLLEGDLEEILTELRPWRRTMPDGGIMAVVWWLDESAAMYDALIGDNHGA
jgi:hypothetical protein